MNPINTGDVRCVIVKPGDVLILVGLSFPDAIAADETLSRLREALQLRAVLACDDLTSVQVRDVDAELARQSETLETYGLLFEMQQAQLNKTLDRLDEARRQLAAHQTADAKGPHE